jgi:toxin ParE1/3/4
VEFRFSRQADLDLEEIALFIARDNPARAFSFVEEIRQHCRRLLRFPEASRLRPEYGPGVRVSVFRRYLIFYVVDADVLRISRVVHGARNLPKILWLRHFSLNLPADARYGAGS